MTARKGIFSTTLRKTAAPLLFAALAVALSAAAACGADAGEADSPTATHTGTTTSPTATPSPSPTPSPTPSPVMLSGLTCTQLFPGVPPEPGGAGSFLSLSVTVTDTGDTDVPVKIGVLGGAIVGAQFFDASGQSLILRETTLVGTTSLEAGQSYEVSINAELKEPGMAETCLFLLLAENSTAMKFSNDATAEVEKIFAP